MSFICANQKCVWNTWDVNRYAEIVNSMLVNPKAVTESPCIAHWGLKKKSINDFHALVDEVGVLLNKIVDICS